MKLTPLGAVSPSAGAPAAAPPDPAVAPAAAPPRTSFPLGAPPVGAPIVLFFVKVTKLSVLFLEVEDVLLRVANLDLGSAGFVCSANPEEEEEEEED